MSGIFGIFNRNTEALKKETLQKMLKDASYWSPDESDIWIKDFIALGHTMLWNTPESKYEHLPFKKDLYVLTMDARIDNRKELALKLDLPGRPLHEIGDSEFILAAYREWGEECPKHLLGDFAFVIWDEKKKQLFCARDHIGIKSLYFFLTDEKFIFSSDITILLDCPAIPKNIDKNTLAIFMDTGALYLKRATFFEQIKKLPPATSMVIAEDEVREIMYWSLEDAPTIRYETFEEYVDELRRLYDEAVDVRLRTDYVVAAHMSGGIDSSPIAVLASRKLKQKNKPLHTFNWIDIPKDEDQYEYEAWNFSRRIAEVEENIIHEEFSIDPEYLAKCAINHNVFTQGTQYYREEQFIQDQMKHMDARVMLSGWGGDELISYNGYSYISGLFSQGKIVKAFDYLFQEKKYRGYTWKKLLKRTIRVLFPHLIEKIRKKRNYIKNDINRYLTKEFESFAKLHKKDVSLPIVSGIKKNQMLMCNYGHLQSRIESWASAGLSKRLEYRYPLLDKRIAEFAIGIPEDLFFLVKGKERHLLKTTVSDLLPEDILWFDKQNETKINQSLEKSSKKMFKIICNTVNINNTENPYIDHIKLKDDFNKCEPDKIASKERIEMIQALFIQNMII